MNWKTIRLELAGTRDFPAGSVSRGYLIRVPLHHDGSIDEAALGQLPRRATVRRFWSNEPDESGRIVRSNEHWALRCNGKPDRLLSSDSFGLGRQIAVRDVDGRLLPFRVAGIHHVG